MAPLPFKQSPGGGRGGQRFVYQKWSKQILPIVNFDFDFGDHFGLGRGGRGFWGGVTHTFGFELFYRRPGMGGGGVIGSPAQPRPTQTRTPAAEKCSPGKKNERYKRGNGRQTLGTRYITSWGTTAP